jgi:tetratricopeptide (TPR) repeat protein
MILIRIIGLKQRIWQKNEGSDNKAVLYLEKVIEKAPYVVEAYKLLSVIYKAQGKSRKAKATLKSSLEWAFDTDEKKQIKYKLYGYTQKSTIDHQHLRE